LHHTACASQERVGSYWHMLPEKEQARKAIWTMINPHTGKKRIDEAFPLEIRARTNDQEMFIEFKNGSTWQIAGSDNYNSLVGSSPCGIVFSEYALANPAAWAYLRPILRENKGWAIFISTPRGKNHFYNLHMHAAKEPGWFHQTLTVDDTKLFSESDLASDLRELQAEHGDQYGKAMWLQENYCSFDAAIPGAIWADAVDRAQVTGRIVDFAIDRKAPVDTGWDLGRTDDTAIWFRQFNGQSIDIIDHFAAPGMDIDNEDEPEKGLMQLLLKKREEYGITYGTHWLPHDARPRTQAAGGKSILQQCLDAAKRHPELGKFAIIPRLDVQEGIIAARKTFPRCRFHKTRCENGLIALRHYHREYDAELKKYNDTPCHDWSSHTADAWRYLSLSWKFKHPTQPESPLIDRLMAANPVGQTFGVLKQNHLRRMKRQRQFAH
jgi:phage terminase large subunit